METLKKYQSLFSDMSKLRVKFLYDKLRRGEVITITHVSLNSKDKYLVDIQRTESELKSGSYYMSESIVSYHITTGDELITSYNVFDNKDTLDNFCDWFLCFFEKGRCLHSECDHFYYMSHEVTAGEKADITIAIEYNDLDTLNRIKYI